ncbi:hypothetical protein MC885_021835 [Smutsia gigantea]|nr:hypothetical protein MC885_021835 [Smutsia gigantea]
MRSSCELWEESLAERSSGPRVQGPCTSRGCFSPEPPAPRQARASDLNEPGRGSREARKAEVGHRDLTSIEKVTWLHIVCHPGPGIAAGDICAGEMTPRDGTVWLPPALLFLHVPGRQGWALRGKLSPEWRVGGRSGPRGGQGDVEGEGRAEEVLGMASAGLSSDREDSAYIAVVSSPCQADWTTERGHL